MPPRWNAWQRAAGMAAGAGSRASEHSPPRAQQWKQTGCEMKLQTLKYSDVGGMCKETHDYKLGNAGKFLGRPCM